MSVIIVTTVKSDVFTSLNLDKSNRAIMLVYFVKLRIEMVFSTDLYR